MIVGLSGIDLSWMVSGNVTALRLSCEFQSSFLWSLASPDIRVIDGLEVYNIDKGSKVRIQKNMVTSRS